MVTQDVSLLSPSVLLVARFTASKNQIPPPLYGGGPEEDLGLCSAGRSGP